MTKRSRYVEIGEKAVQRLAEHLRKKGCDVQITNGTYGKPDLIYNSYAVEVKHVQFLYRKMTGNKQYVQFGDFMCDKEVWKNMCEWAKQNNYYPCIIAVTEISRKVRLFLYFSHCQVEELMKRNEGAKRMHVPSWEMLMLGEPIRG